MTRVTLLDDRRPPHPRRTQRLQRMAQASPPPPSNELAAVRAHLHRAHADPALRAEILAIMKEQVA